MSRIPEAQEMKGSGKSSSFLLPLFIIRLKNCQNLFSCPRVSCAPVFGCVEGTWHGGRAEMLGTDTQIQQDSDEARKCQDQSLPVVQSTGRGLRAGRD